MCLRLEMCLYAIKFGVIEMIRLVDFCKVFHRFLMCCLNVRKVG